MTPRTHSGWKASHLVWLLLIVAASGCATTSSSKKVSGPTAEHSDVRPNRLQVAGIERAVADSDLEARYDASIFDSAPFRASRQDAELRFWSGPAVMGSFISCYRCESCWQCQRDRCPSCDPADGSCPSSCSERCPCDTCSSKCFPLSGVVAAPSDIWVSFADQVRSFCQDFPREDLVLRMQQLQGLPPNLSQPEESWKVLSVAVNSSAQLFRPCTDPDPTTPGPCTALFPPWVSEDHQAWIAGQAMSAWEIPDGYPWTRQGYTYNWHGDPKDPATIVGTSEFVIPGGTEVQVLELQTVREFCYGSPQ